MIKKPQKYFFFVKHCNFTAQLPFAFDAAHTRLMR